MQPVTVSDMIKMTSLSSFPLSVSLPVSAERLTDSGELGVTEVLVGQGPAAGWTVAEGVGVVAVPLLVFALMLVLVLVFVLVLLLLLLVLVVVVMVAAVLAPPAAAAVFGGQGGCGVLGDRGHRRGGHGQHGLLDRRRLFT